ncbi:hypothetical protein [Xanthomonas hyacinthi]|uniref:hypothetical protein n=1 Tax=Xanthomonas hyacinthi TaxID=56455 RepID=UPI001AD61B9E|nr:hypothetical protein [Xanthomonas hyacinthi]
MALGRAVRAGAGPLAAAAARVLPLRGADGVRLAAASGLAVPGLAVLGLVVLDSPALDVLLAAVFAAVRRTGPLGRATAFSAVCAWSGFATACFGLAFFAAGFCCAGGAWPACAAALAGFAVAADTVAARFRARPPSRARCCLVAIAVLPCLGEILRPARCRQAE